MTPKEVRYYAATHDGKRWVEVLVTSQNTRTISEVPTGTTYRSFKAMDEAIGQKNQQWLA